MPTSGAVKIGILSFKSLDKRATEEELRLLRAARSRGHRPRIFRADKCQLLYETGKPRVFYDGKPFPEIDVLIPRVSVVSKVDLNVSFVKQFELMGVPVVNSYLSILRAKNKLRTMQMLDHEGVLIPKTIVVRGLPYVDWAIKAVSGPPVVLKTAFGSYGSGVVIAESKRAIASALDAIYRTSGSNVVLIQQYIKEARGRDLRVFVVGDRIVAAMERRAKRGDFRANAELGGAAVPATLSDAEKTAALRAASALQLSVVGVDLIRTNNGPAVLEVNANPGFKTLEEVTQAPVAEAIVDFAVSVGRKAFPQGQHRSIKPPRIIERRLIAVGGSL